MKYLVYKTKIGKYTIIADTELFNYFNSSDSSTHEVYKNGTFTSYGRNLFSKFDSSLLYGDIFYKGPVQTASKNAFLSLFPAIKLSTFPNEKTGRTEIVDSRTNGKYLFVYVSSSTILSSVDTYISYGISDSNFLLFGRFIGYNQSSTESEVSYNSIYIFNDELTNYAQVSFTNRFGTIQSSINKSDDYSRNIIVGFLGSNKPDYEATKDPYTSGGTSESGGGGGTFGGGSTIFGGNTDPVDIPDLPSLSAVDTGFITLFNPTLTQLNSLASYMWSDVFSLDTFKKLYADPMDCILGLSIVPVQPTSGGTGTVKIGNISTDVTMNKASSQYVSVDCGTVEVKEYWGGYLDYSPYTKCEIYLPYVGVHEISVDDIMNKSVHIVYHVDILSGACNAYVKCGDSVLYTFIGQCSSSIPISGNDWTNTINGVLSIAGNIGSLVASGGASAPTELPSMAQNVVNALKPNIEKSGAMSGTGGMLGIQKPYIILTRPNQALPENQNKYTGYPSFITMNLSECSGYTEIETIRLENMTCTDDELTEIETLLKQGVVF